MDSRTIDLTTLENKQMETQEKDAEFTMEKDWMFGYSGSAVKVLTILLAGNDTPF